jgi:hypothetical protein
MNKSSADKSMISIGYGFKSQALAAKQIMIVLISARKKLALLLLSVVGLTGCVSVPPVPSASTESRSELAAHVNFLARPELGGRKPRTRGSRLARRYIEARFKACGLAPWSQATDYELPFGLGRNIVGVLPGSDPKCAKEMVLLSAHYDHLGKDETGKICPGAADNAAGVAVLLEAAKQISSLAQRPKRSIAFVAFDCEEQMLVGSLAFSCRDDVTKAKIAAVVNMDILGRDFFDVVRNTLFVAGTESYPALREQVCRFGTNAAIRVLPLGSDLVGPRSDHVSFESLEVPCLFFSSGPYRDYHRPGDTADKINFDALERSAKVVAGTVRSLAEGQAIQRETNAMACDANELRTVTTVMSEVSGHEEEAGVKKDDVAAFQKLEDQAQALIDSGRYGPLARKQLILDATGVLLPYVMPLESNGKPKMSEQEKEYLKEDLQFLQYLYLTYPREIMDGSRKLVGQIVRYHPGLFRGMPRFDFEIYDIPAQGLSLTRAGNTNSLRVFINQFSLSAEVKPTKWLIRAFRGNVSASLQEMNCDGTQEQLADYCLLQWISQGRNLTHAPALRKVLQAVNGEEPGDDPWKLVNRRVQRGGFKDATDWICQGLLSGNPDLTLAALYVARKDHDRRISAAVSRVIADRDLRADVRAFAIEMATTRAEKPVLLAMCDVLDDATPSWKPDYERFLDQSSPYATQPALKIIRPTVEKVCRDQAKTAKPIGDLARSGLRTATGKNFGGDASRWRGWLESHPKEKSL